MEKFFPPLPDFSRPAKISGMPVTVFEAFMETANAAWDHAFLCVPRAPGRAYDPDGLELSYAAVRAGAPCGRARARHGVRAALHLGHDGASEGMRAYQLLLPERGYLVPRPRRSPRDPSRRGALLQSAAALPHESPGRHGDVRDPHRELSRPARALQPDALVAGHRGDTGDDRPLPRRGAAAAPQPAAVAG